RAHERRLRAGLAVIEHMHLEPALLAHEARQEADRTGAGHQHGARTPGARARADALGLVPRLGDDARRLDQHPEDAERRIDLDCEIGLDAELLGAEPVALLDAALDVAAVAAHVPLAGRAGRARDRIRPAHDTDEVVAGREAAARRRLLD